MAALASTGAEWVQQLFEQHLGPPRTLPDVVGSASSSAAGADVREHERVSFRMTRGIAIDYQAVPAAGTLLGMTYQPQRPAPRRMPRARAAHSGAPPLAAAAREAAAAPEEAATANGTPDTAALTSATTASSSQVSLDPIPVTTAAVQPEAAKLPAPLHPQPAHATLWALVQPTPRVGINTAVSAVDAGPTGFGGWHQDGFVDLSRRLGLDYSLSRHPASGLCAEMAVQATLPKLLLLPEVTAQHRVAGAQASTGLQRTTTVTAPLIGGAAQARVRVHQADAEPEARTLTFELQGRGKRSGGSSRGLAGGAKLQPAVSSAFYGSGWGSSTGGTAADTAGSDSEDEDSVSGRQQGKRPVPGLRLHVAPATRDVAWEHVSGHWRQAWGRRLNTSVGYQGRQRRWNLELGAKLGNRLSAAGTLVCTGPAEIPAVPMPAAAGSDGSSSGSGSGTVEPWAQRVQHARQTARAYVAASQLCRAGVRVTCRLPRPARQQLHLESSLGESGELSHALRYRLGGSVRSDWAQQRARADLALESHPAQGRWQLKFDVFAPL